MQVVFTFCLSSAPVLYSRIVMSRLPKYSPGVKRRFIRLLSLISTSPFTQNPGENPGCSIYHSSPSAVISPLWENVMSCVCIPTENPKCQRRISAYGRLSTQSLSDCADASPHPTPTIAGSMRRNRYKHIVIRSFITKRVTLPNHLLLC